MKKIKLCSVSDVPELKPKCLTTEDTYIAVYRHNNEFIAIKDECPHQMASFEASPNIDGIITCAFHGWSFRLEDGQPHKGFGCLTKYPVTIIENEIWIDFTEASETDDYQKAFIK